MFNHIILACFRYEVTIICLAYLSWCGFFTVKLLKRNKMFQQIKYQGQEKCHA